MGKRGGKPKERVERNQGPGPDPSRRQDPDSALAWAWADEKVPKRHKATPRVIPPDEVSVDKGARWLDIVAVGWFRKLPPNEVDIQSVQGCPLASSFRDDKGRPDFAAGVRMLCRPMRVKPRESSLLTGEQSLVKSVRPQSPQFRGADTDQLAAYGFCPYRDDPRPDPYPTLSFLWSREIQKRLNMSLAGVPR